jgi:hypothetical protein
MTPPDDTDDFDSDALDGQCPADAVETEFMGRYPSLAAFVREALEVLVLPDGWWILDCLDLPAVIREMEGEGRFRLRVADGRVFRDRMRV